MPFEQGIELAAEIKPERDWDAQAHAADRFAATAAGLFLQRVGGVDELLGGRHKPPSLLVKLSRMRAALDQAGRKMLLKRRSLSRYGGLRDATLFRYRRERADFGDAEKSA